MSTKLESERKDMLVVYANHADQDSPLQALKIGPVPLPPVPMAGYG